MTKFDRDVGAKILGIVNKSPFRVLRIQGNEKEKLTAVTIRENSQPNFGAFKRNFIGKNAPGGNLLAPLLLGVHLSVLRLFAAM